MKIKKISALFLAVTITATFMAACGGSNTVEDEVLPYPTTVKGVTVEQAPRAVASLSAGITDILVDLGYHKKIVGYSDGYILPDPPVVEEPVVEEKKFRWFWEPKEEVKEPEPELPKGEIGTALDPNLEKIGEYMPEIVFTTLPMTKANLDKLSGVNIKVVVLPTATTTQEIKDNYIAVINAVEGQVEANGKGVQLTGEAEFKLEYIKSMIPAKKQSFLYVASTKPLVATGDSYEHELLSVVGTNVAGDMLQYNITGEQLAELDPDVILYAKSVGRDYFTQSEAFSAKTAVANNILIEIDENMFKTQTLAFVEEIRAIASTLYPSVDFSEPVITDEESGEGSSSEE